MRCSPVQLLGFDEGGGDEEGVAAGVADAAAGVADDEAVGAGERGGELEQGVGAEEPGTAVVVAGDEDGTFGGDEFDVEDWVEGEGGDAGEDGSLCGELDFEDVDVRGVVEYREGESIGDCGLAVVFVEQALEWRG